MTTPADLHRVTLAGQQHAEGWRQGALRDTPASEKSRDRWRGLVADAASLAEAAGSDVVRVAFMGRVKAGKSTLVNGLVGRRVAGTHAFELSAAIHEIRPSGEAGECGRILRAGAPPEVSSPEGIADLIEANRGSADYWSRVIAIETEVEMSHMSEPFVVFDTPGIGTLTKANAQRAADFLNAVHVVAWVQSGLSLGNVEDEKYLREIVRRGLPVIPVITRADHMDEEDTAEVLEWFASSFPELPEPVLVSAMSWRDEPEAADRARLLERLQASVQVADTASPDGLRADVADAAKTEVEDLGKLDMVLAQVDEATERTKRRVVAAVKSAMLSKVDAVLRARGVAIRERLQRVEGREPGEALRRVIEEELGDRHTRALLEALEAEATEQLASALGREIGDQLDDLENHLQASASSLDLDRLDAMRRQINDLAVKHEAEFEGGSAAVAGGAALGTAWAAWFGANAAAVSFGAAMMSVGLPVLAGGGALLYFRQYGAKKKLKNALIAEGEQMLAEYRERLIKDVLEPHFFPALEQDVAAASDAIGDVILRDILGGASRGAIEAARAFFREVAGAGGERTPLALPATARV